MVLQCPFELCLRRPTSSLPQPSSPMSAARTCRESNPPGVARSALIDLSSVREAKRTEKMGGRSPPPLMIAEPSPWGIDELLMPPGE